MRYLTPVLLAVAASVLSTAPAYADLGDQLFKLLPKDGAAEDYFGTSVAINGTTAIVGANGNDDNANESGSVYLFDTTTGKQIAKLLPDDGAAEEWFGTSVAISGHLGKEIAIVGAVWDQDNGVQSGSAYLFNITMGRQIAKLLPKDGEVADEFGRSVAISGATAIVGAKHHADNGYDSGAAYLFDTTTGLQLFKLLPNDGAAADYFGGSVAISGQTAIIGAIGDDDNGPGAGSAYLFETATGRQIGKLLANDGAAGDRFGASVAISGTRAIVGAAFDDYDGSAYLFDISDPVKPTQIAKLLANDGEGGDQFGRSVAISGAIAIVGAWVDDDNGLYAGSAYLFDTTTGKQIAKLLPDDGATFDIFGQSVAISGAPGNETAIVGAAWNNDNGTQSGSAYLFDAAGTPGECPWDLDANGSVGATDLLTLLTSWGPCKGCPADFDGNSSVDESDLAALLANWGPCP